MDGTLVQRADKVAFFGVVGETGEVTYHRMQGFTDMSKSQNPKEYSRQYVDEEFEQADVVGYSPSIAYSFDQYVGDPVHDEIVKLSDNEAVGSNAVRTIVIVDMTKAGTKAGTFVAAKRDFSVIADSEGNSFDAYTYSGNFKVKGSKIEGVASTTDEWQTLTFEEPSEEVKNTPTNSPASEGTGTTPKVESKTSK